MSVTYFLLLIFSAFRVRGSTRSCIRPGESAITYRGNGDDLKQVYRALVTCPKITSLDVEFVWGGCSMPTEPWAFQFRKGDRFSGLSTLRLSDYDFTGDRNRWRFGGVWSNWRQPLQDVLRYAPFLPSIELSRNDSHIEEWLRAVDFSQLRELHLSHDSAARNDIFYGRMKDELPGLRNLSLDWPSTGMHPPENYVTFIRSMPSLDSMSIWIDAPSHWREEADHNRTQFPLQDILKSHCPSLQSLSLHQRESYHADLRRPMLSIEDITSIRASCPNLRHLGLDIDRDISSGWPNATLNALGSIESLESLVLRLELGNDLHQGDDGEYTWNPEGIDTGGPFREPRMSPDVAESLFDDLRNRKQGVELHRADFVVGDFEDPPFAGPMYMPSWGEGRPRKFVCEAGGGGEGVEAGRRCRILGNEASQSW